jgi:hypothetical protein
MSHNDVTISLRRDEALLVDSFLRKYTDNDLLQPDKSETQALYNLACIIEQQLPELLDPEYKDILGAARKQIFEEDRWA